MTFQASKITSIKRLLKAAAKACARAKLMDHRPRPVERDDPRELTAGTICIAAQMKRPSFYTYFDSVDALLTRQSCN